MTAETLATRSLAKDGLIQLNVLSHYQHISDELS